MFDYLYKCLCALANATAAITSGAPVIVTGVKYTGGETGRNGVITLAAGNLRFTVSSSVLKLAGITRAVLASAASIAFAIAVPKNAAIAAAAAGENDRDAERLRVPGVLAVFVPGAKEPLTVPLAQVQVTASNRTTAVLDATTAAALTKALISGINLAKSAEDAKLKPTGGNV